MSMADLSRQFGDDPAAHALPTRSEGKENFGKGKGKDQGGGFRDNFREREESRADTGDWFQKRDGPGGGGSDRDRDRDRDRGGAGFRGAGGHRGGGERGGDRPPRRDEGPSRADTGDWCSKERPAGEDRDRRQGGYQDRGGGFGRDRQNDQPSRGGDDDNWRAGGGGNFIKGAGRVRRKFPSGPFRPVRSVRSV